MSSPGNKAFGSPENNDSPPLYPSTDRFVPLGFSTPQHHSVSGTTQNRNYHSAQPKYMQPRQRGGFQGRNRPFQKQYHHQQHQRNNRRSYEDEQGDQGRHANDGRTERNNFSRSWRGRNNNQRDRFGGQHHHQHRHSNKNDGYSIEDYFHPSMLEDPWKHLVQKLEAERVDQSKEHSAQIDDDSDDGGEKNEGLAE